MKRRIGTIAVALLLVGLTGCVSCKKAGKDYGAMPQFEAVKMYQDVPVDGVVEPVLWDQANAYEFTINRPEGDPVKVRIRALYNCENIYVLLQWPDADPTETHRTWVWNEKEKRYDESFDREDHMALKWEMFGNYNARFMSAKEYCVDIWRWCAALTNPQGFALDMRALSCQTHPQVVKSTKYIGDEGQRFWFWLPIDRGELPYIVKDRPAKYISDAEPQYVANPVPPSDSAADLKAKGVWKDGIWTVEIARKLDTGWYDDVYFKPGAPKQRRRHFWLLSLCLFEEDDIAAEAVSETIRFYFGSDRAKHDFQKPAPNYLLPPTVSENPDVSVGMPEEKAD